MSGRVISYQYYRDQLSLCKLAFIVLFILISGQYIREVIIMYNIGGIT